jgi:Mlc titration factor MtfA (ptsG expression regulator)
MLKTGIAKWSLFFWKNQDSEVIHATLRKYSPYFRMLGPSDQKRFIYRVALFSRSMKFKALGDHAINSQMRYLIASGLVQITFGLKAFTFHHFRKILVTPRAYGYRGFKNKLLGHVDYSNRLITLSWANSRHGFEVEDDAHNAVLHEMAHALEFEYRKWLKKLYNYRNKGGILNLIISVTLPKGYMFFDEANYRTWLDIARAEMHVMKMERNYFLKDYAAKNIHEYFACAVEAFFEKPKAMKAAIPQVYMVLRKLLNQDPIDHNKPRLN